MTIMARVISGLFLTSLIGSTFATASPDTTAPKVKIETNVGAIVLELNAKQAPKTVANFLRYVDSGFYTNTVFHRVIPGFMVQGGGMTAELKEKATQSPIENEADNGLKNDRATIAMARTGDPHSASAQFFINVTNNPALDFRSKTMSGWGYAVFGRVIDGMNTVEKIERTPTTSSGMFSDVPKTPIIIKKMSRIQ